MSEPIVEHVSGGAHEYEVSRQVADSTLIPGEQWETGARLFGCPRCAVVLPDFISHGERTECTSCGLGVTLHGNRLTIDGKP